MKQSPCRFCTERAVGCHSICPKYEQFRIENEAARTKRNMEQMITGTLIEGARRVDRTKFSRQKGGAGAWRE